MFLYIKNVLLLTSDGVLQSGIYETLALAIGVVFGAQLGARLSKPLKGRYIILSLALALGLVGVRIFIMAF